MKTERNSTTNRHHIFRTLTIFIVMLLAGIASAQNPPEPITAPEPERQPPTPSTSESVFGHLFPEAPMDAMAGSADLKAWFDDMARLANQMRQIAELGKAQMQVLDRVRAHREPGNGPPPYLTPESRGPVRDSVRELHTFQEQLDALQEEWSGLARNLADRTDLVLPHFEALREKWAADPATTEKEDSPQAQNLRQLDQLIALLQDYQERPGDPNRLVHNVWKGLFLKSAFQRGFLLQRFQERIDRLEREQAVLSRRLEANRRELEEIKEQLDRTTRARGRRARPDRDRESREPSGNSEQDPAPVPNTYPDIPQN